LLEGMVEELAVPLITLSDPVVQRGGHCVGLGGSREGGVPIAGNGGLAGAGGIGGLLARTDLTTDPTAQPAYYHADGNGNVTMLVNSAQLVVARYLYDAFGNTLSLSGPLAFANLYRFSSKETHQNSGLVYYLFDLLYLDGIDLRGVGLAQRKALLGQTLARIPPPFADTLRLSDHVIGQGPEFFAQASRMGLEGIVSKQLDAPYCSGRSRHWLKVKCSQRQEFVVVGFSDPKRSRTLLGALLLATHTGDALVYRGRVGTGFSEASLRDLHRKLAPLRASQPPVAHAREVPVTCA